MKGFYICSRQSTIFWNLLPVTFDSYKDDKILKFAIIKNLEIIGEAAYLLSKDFKTKNDSVEWNDIIGMCHILVHGYYQIKDEIIWATIETDLLPLKSKLETLK